MLDISANLGNKLNIALTVRDSALPLLPNWLFDELTAKGELSNNDLSISESDARIFGGVLQGNASIGWHQGWRAQGNIVAKTITMQRLNNLLRATLKVRRTSKCRQQTWLAWLTQWVLDGSFISKKG